MSFRTFTLQSVVVGTNKCLTSDVTIAFTVEPVKSAASSTREVPVIAWKVLQFSKGSVEVKQLRLYHNRRIGVADIEAEGSLRWIRTPDNGAGLGPNQHLSISDAGKWSSESLFGLRLDSSFVTNNASHPLMFSLGTRSPTGSFEPMALLPQLQHEEGIQVRYPVMMQAYDMTGMDCVEGGILPGPLDGETTLQDLALFRESKRRPDAIDTRTLNEDVAFHVYSGIDGKLVLERITRPKRVLIPRPPILPRILIPSNSSPHFGSPVRSPILNMLRPRSPNFLLTPGFNMSWTHPTPPHTPAQPWPHSPPLSLVSPDFLSPLLTPTPENGSQVFVPS